MTDKFNFDLKKSAIYQAVLQERCPVFGSAGLFKKLFLVLSVFVFLVSAYLFLSGALDQKVQSSLFGLAIIFLVFFFVFWLAEVFFNLKLKKPRLRLPGFGGQAELIGEVLKSPERYNLADFLSFESAKAVSACLSFSKERKIPRISSTQLFYFLLSDENLNFVFFRALLNFKEIKEVLKKYLQAAVNSESRPPETIYQKDFQESIIESLKIADKKNHPRIEPGDLIAALAGHDLIFRKILIDNNLKTEDIENLVRWREVLEEKISENKKFWQRKNLIKRGSLAKEWAAGYTVVLDQFSTDLSEVVRKRGFPEVIGHKKEIELMERILARNEINNVLIIGEPGSGRKSMIYDLANKSVLGETLLEVKNKRVVQLDLPALLAQISSSEEVEATLDNIFKEAISAGNVILVIDEFHNFVGSYGRPGVIDISGIISSYLAWPSFQIIAISTFEGLHKNIEQNSSLLSLFEKIEVAEISERETLILLENLGLALEQKYKKFISYPALREIIDCCKKYLPGTPFPEKAMDLLDEAMVYLAQSEEKILLPKHIDQLVMEKTEIPVGEIEKKEKDILLNLEEIMHQRIINQETAIKEVCAALRRARAEIAAKSGPMGSFLFLGPTGVGKTETAKALAEAYFGSEQKMIRLDMSEFQSTADIPRLLGAPGEEGLLTTQVRENPFSLILLDELEKAHPNILNLFLQVLDEGHLTDGSGRKVSFKNAIIIATSNAGYQIILRAIKEKINWEQVKQKLLDYLFEEGLFRPEFINRFDAMVVFKPLSKENLLAIASLMLEKLKKGLKEKEIELVITGPLKEKIVELSYEPTFGARQMKRVIQDKIENVLASALLAGEIKRGDRLQIDPDNFKLKINF